MYYGRYNLVVVQCGVVDVVFLCGLYGADCLAFSDDLLAFDFLLGHIDVFKSNVTVPFHELSHEFFAFGNFFFYCTFLFL